MPRIKGTSNEQRRFLRALRKSPAGPAADDWPSPAILRRWLRSRGFVAAMRSLEATLRWQADFELILASANAAKALQSCVGNAASPEAQKQLKVLADVVKLSLA